MGDEPIWERRVGRERERMERRMAIMRMINMDRHGHTDREMDRDVRMATEIDMEMLMRMEIDEERLVREMGRMERMMMEGTEEGEQEGRAMMTVETRIERFVRDDARMRWAMDVMGLAATAEQRRQQEQEQQQRRRGIIAVRARCL